MGSKWPGSREHGFIKTREQGAKEINLGSGEHGPKGHGAGQKGQGAGIMTSKRPGSTEKKRLREQGAIILLIDSKLPLMQVKALN